MRYRIEARRDHIVQRYLDRYDLTADIENGVAIVESDTEPPTWGPIRILAIDEPPAE